MTEWEIDIEKLKGPDRSKLNWFTDEIYLSPDNLSACLVYSIAETSMNWYTGKLAIFKDKDHPKILFNTLKINCDGTKKHVVYFDNGKKIVIRAKVYDPHTNTIYVPFLIIDLEKKLYAYIAIVNGCHYEIESRNSNSLELIEDYKDNSFPSRDHEIVDLAELAWHNIKKINNFNEEIIAFFRKSQASLL